MNGKKANSDRQPLCVPMAKFTGDCRARLARENIRRSRRI